jgi:hypothetical protein
LRTTTVELRVTLIVSGASVFEPLRWQRVHHRKFFLQTLAPSGIPALA